MNIFAGGPDWYRHGQRIARAYLDASQEHGIAAE